MFNLDFPRALPAVQAKAFFRQDLADFVVDERLGFSLSGSGEHLCLFIEKAGQNTLWVAKQLASHFDVSLQDVGYCGLKDRRAITRQWFSVRQPGAGVPGLEEVSFDIEGVQLLEVARHQRKLRPGEHAANGFFIRLREVTGDHAILDSRFAQISRSGVPNYFGEQRFGIHGGNLQAALELSKAHPGVWRQRKHQFALSAIRSWLFNCVLAERVRQGNWDECIEGEAGSVSSGPLWGRGRLASSGTLRAIEENIASSYSDWKNILEHTGLSQERRVLCLMLLDTCSSWEGEDWLLSFVLPPGTYATSVIRELLETVIPVAER